MLTFLVEQYERAALFVSVSTVTGTQHGAGGRERGRRDEIRYRGGLMHCERFRRRPHDDAGDTHGDAAVRTAALGHTGAPRPSRPNITGTKR